jgi:hypothetical protein
VSRLYSNNLSFQSQSVVLHFFFLTTSTAVSRLYSNNLSFQSQSVVLFFFFLTTSTARLSRLSQSVTTSCVSFQSQSQSVVLHFFFDDEYSCVSFVQ